MSSGRPSGSKKGLDLRELEDAEPELFEEGTLAAFRDCCARLAGCSSADADALFRLVDDDKDGALGRREVIEFVRDTGESWSRRAGLDAAALDISPRSDGDVSAQYSDEDDDDRSVAFEPLVKQLRKRKASTKRTGGAPHMRAVASRIAGALVEDRDGDYEEGHAGKTRQGYLTRPLYDDLEKSERREGHGHGVTWDQLYAAFKRRGVVRALSSRDLELLRDEYAGGADLVRDWRNLLKAVDEAAGEAPDDSPRDRDAKLARAAAQQLLDAAARTEAKGSDSDSEGGRDAFAQSLRDLFADMDADGDGVLTKREVRDALADLGERDNRPGMRPHQIQALRRDRLGRRRRGHVRGARGFSRGADGGVRAWVASRGARRREFAAGVGHLLSGVIGARHCPRPSLLQREEGGWRRSRRPGKCVRGPRGGTGPGGYGPPSTARGDAGSPRRRARTGRSAGPSSFHRVGQRRLPEARPAEADFCDVWARRIRRLVIFLLR